MTVFLSLKADYLVNLQEIRRPASGNFSFTNNLNGIALSKGSAP
jgi:hypothetical protein